MMSNIIRLIVVVGLFLGSVSEAGMFGTRMYTCYAELQVHQKDQDDSDDFSVIGKVDQRIHQLARMSGNFSVRQGGWSNG